MKKNLNIISYILFLTLFFSCSNSENELTDNPADNPKSVTECEYNFPPNTLSGICLNGAELALPSEILTYTSTHVTSHGIFNPQFTWTIENGSIEILNIENSIVNAVTSKSIVTVKFKADFSGNGIIKVQAETDHSGGITEIFVELES